MRPCTVGLGLVPDAKIAHLRAGEGQPAGPLAGGEGHGALEIFEDDGMAQVRANAQVMAEKLRPFGWEYVVVDIQWYAHRPGSMREQFQYIPFGVLEMEEYT